MAHCETIPVKQGALKRPRNHYLDKRLNCIGPNVAGTLNECYVYVAQDIASEPISEVIVNHPRIQTITAHIPAPIAFDFSPVTPERIDTFIYKSNSRKASGVDGIPAKIINSGSYTISEPQAK